MRISSLLPIVAIAAALAAPVCASAQQMTAKQAWDRLRSAAHDRGIMISAQEMVDGATALTARTVSIYRIDDPASARMDMAELSIEPRGDAGVALIPSETVTVSMPAANKVERVFTLHPNGEVLYDGTDQTIDLAANFASLSASLTSATQAGNPLDEGLNMTLTGLNAQFHAVRTGSADLTLDVGDLRYDFRMTQAEGPMPGEQVGQAHVASLHLALSGNELDMVSGEPGSLAAAFDAGFFAHLLISTGESTGQSRQMIDGQTVVVDSQSSGSELRLDVADGAFSASTEAGAGRLQGGYGPMQGDLSFDGLGFQVGFPLVPSDIDQRFVYAMHLDGLAPSAATLGLVGAQAFAGDAISLAVGVSADGRLTHDLGTSMTEGDTLPLDLTNIRLDQLDLSIGDTHLTGAGAFAFLGGLSASVGAKIPQGTGDFTFDLVGGEALLTRLSEAGLLPADQQFFARMMMNGLGRAVGADHLTSQVAIRPGGVVTVNGAPLPF